MLRAGRRGALVMSAPFKYAFVLALGLAFGFCIHARPNLEEVAKLAWLDEINVTINKAVARLKPQAAVFAVDPVAAARVGEDLDYRIAERIGSVEGWRLFLAVHGSGVHAQTATGEVERLLLSEQTSRRRPLRSQMSRPSAPKLRVIPCGLPRFRPGPKLRLSPPRAGSAAWAPKRR